MAADPVQLIGRYDRLHADRAIFASHWQEIHDLLYPSGDPIVGARAKGAKAHGQVLDGTGEHANEFLAAGLHQMLTNPAAKWFGLRVLDESFAEDEEVRLWLEDAARRMYGVFNSPASNFASAQHEKYMDLVTYGTACLYIADRPGQLPLFAARPIEEIVVDQNAEGRIDTLFRAFPMTARQAVEQWGERAGADIAAAAADPAKQDQSFRFLHAVYPRPDYEPGRTAARFLPFASCWVAVDHRHLIGEGGYHEFPFVVPRWSKRAMEVYGRGPGMKALADVKMLQRIMQATIRGVEKRVRPALLVADDGVLSPVNVADNSITHVRGDFMTRNGPPVRPLDTGARPDIGEEFMAGVRARIEAAFHTPLFRFARDPQMTATQYLGITEQTMQVLNPVLGRLQVEDLGPLITRLFGIMWRARLFASPPPQLAGQTVRPEYVSPVAKQQRIGEARAIAQTFEIMAPVLALDPSAADNFDADQGFRHVGDLSGLPAFLLRSKRTVQEMRQARAEVAQAQAAKQDMVELAMAAGQAAPALQLAGA